MRVARTHQIIACVAIVLALALLFGCSTERPAIEEDVAQPTFAPCAKSMLAKLSDSAPALREKTVDSCFKTGYRAYVLSRVVSVAPNMREPASFGPWTAEEEYLAADAREDGSLTEWFDNYYITHQWSDVGQQILGLVPGDDVTVNGRTFRIEGICNYPKESFYDEIVELCGPNKVVLQTCYPDSEYNRIAYGA